MNVASDTTIELTNINGRDVALHDALSAVQLPTDDLNEPGRLFFRATRAGRAVGFGGLELYGADALLRSVVILLEHRKEGAGTALTEALLSEAATNGATKVYLLTEAAGAFFARLGFVPIERTDAPATITNTRQAAALCPSSATLMVAQCRAVRQ